MMEAGIIYCLFLQKLSFRCFVAVLKFTPDATFKFNIQKSLIEKNLQMKVLAYSQLYYWV